MDVGRAGLLLAVACVLTTPAAGTAAPFSGRQIRCIDAIGKLGLEYVRVTMKRAQRCREAVLAGGSCAAPDPAVRARLDRRMQRTFARVCTLPETGLAGLGFPGPCPDPNPGDGFTANDLAACIRDSHEAIVEQMLELQFEDGRTGPLPKEALACQREVAKQSLAFTGCMLKAVQKCRNKRLQEALPSVPPHLCASDDVRTAATISQCREKLHDGIAAVCSDATIAGLAVCTPDAATVAAATSCLAAAYASRIDGAAIDVPPDLIDYEYAVRGGLCGDGKVNNLAEECDGADDSACPGRCGSALTPDGYFACLCTDKPRVRVVEHAAADTDNGWTGISADQGVAEGGGYLGDLYDCDEHGLCNLGPSCSLPPHSSCAVPLSAASGTTGNEICALLGQGTCRKERTATGPHCFQDVQKKCDPNLVADPVCNAPGDFCATTLVGPPNPVSSGGVTVCNVTVWSEDVVGTVNLASGESSVRAPQRSRTYNRSAGSANKPCPVCGGFCAVSRERCEETADCGVNKGPCITAPVCSDGMNAGKPCRTTPPFAGTSEFFGTTSVDCLPAPSAQITSPAGLDLYVTTRSTGPLSMEPTLPCTASGFSGNVCHGGTNEGRACAEAGDCPQGRCGPQCFCAGQLRPNACDPACVGGSQDALECHDDADCPGGFCHPGDCRVDVDDHGSIQEGVCTAGPVDAWCSLTTYRPCRSNAECAPPACPYCQAGESCLAKKRACFVNSGIVRQGTPRTPEGASVGIYCIAGDNAATNTVAGFPGPAAFTQPELQLTVP